jgi:hypothetical protein
LLASKIEACDGPRSCETESDVERYRDRGRHQGQADCRASFGIDDRGEVRADSLLKCLGKNRDHRQE